MKTGNQTGLRPEILLLALINVAVHIIIASNLEYHRDELLYFSLGQHPAAGYATVPPVIGWLAFLVGHTFGYSVTAVRLLPALFSGMMIILAALMAREMGGSRYSSFLASAGLMVSTFFMRTFTLYQPVFVEVFIWTMALYLILKYVNTGKDIFVILFGITAGFALLNKYLALLLLASVVCCLPFTIYRTIFRKKAFWYALACAFIIFLPNMIWQLKMGFPVFRHMSELYDTQLVHMDIPLFLGEQILMPFTGTLLTIAGLIFLLFMKRGDKYRLTGYVAIVVIVALMFLKGKSYYTLGVFPLLTAAGAVFWDKLMKRNWMRILLPSVMVFLTLFIIPMGMPVYEKEGMKKYFKKLEERYGMTVGRRFEDGSIHSLPQDYADMIGWEELTRVVADTYRGIDDKKSCFIYCENYGQAGAITVIGKKYGLPEAVCFSESFSYWFPASFNPDIKTMIYINDEPGEDVRSLFRTITKAGEVTDPDAREFGTKVFVCSDPAGSFNHFWTLRTGELIKERR